MIIKVGYLGPAGTFTEQAARKWLVNNIETEHKELLPVNNIPKLVYDVLNKNFNYGVLPIENSIEGTVNLAIDTLIKAEINIVGEIVIKIDHCLAARKKHEKLTKIFSHPQALAQCYDYLNNNLSNIDLIQTLSTSEAAKIVANGPPDWAAICSREAAKRYGLELLATGIQDHLGNKTRFLAIGEQPLPIVRSSIKTSLVIALPENRPGGLYKILKVFADRGINLTKIESRPTKKELGEYLFWIDCEAHLQDKGFNSAIQELSQQAVLLKILGSYPQDKGA